MQRPNNEPSSDQEAKANAKSPRTGTGPAPNRPAAPSRKPASTNSAPNRSKRPQSSPNSASPNSPSNQGVSLPFPPPAHARPSNANARSSGGKGRSSGIPSAENHPPKSIELPSHWKPDWNSPSVSTRVERQKALGELLFQSPGVWRDRAERQMVIADRVLSRSKVMRSRNFQTVARQDLEAMAHEYDGIFFQGYCLPLAASYGLSFRLSSRMTRAGGKTTRTIYPSNKGQPSRTHYEIALSTSLLFQSFRSTDDTIRVCGYDCPDRLTAMQRIVEHEMIHLCEMLVWIQSDCAANRFQSIARNMFGHSEHRHELITQQERAAKEFNIRAGKRVAFRFEGQTLVGVVNRITRRATILVEDARGQRFSDGRYYVKYYVPINQLRPIA